MNKLGLKKILLKIWKDIVTDFSLMIEELKQGIEITEKKTMESPTSY